MFDVSPKSRLSYRKEGLKFVRAARHFLKRKDVGGIADVLNTHVQTNNLSRNTYRHYRNSIAFTLSEVEGGDYAKTFNDICREKISPPPNKKRRYRKHVPQNVVVALLQLASDRNLKSYKFVARLVSCMYYTGIRPGEWGKTSYDPDKGVLTVVNSKFKASANLQRGNGRKRWLEINPADKPNLEKHLLKLLEEMRDKDWATLQGNASRTLKSMLQELIDQKRITRWWKKLRIYDFRHQCCANLKSFYSKRPTMVSAMMGHLSAATAYIHYGQRRFAHGGGIRVKPSEESEFLVKRSSVVKLKKLMLSSAKRKAFVVEHARQHGLSSRDAQSHFSQSPSQEKSNDRKPPS